MCATVFDSYGGPDVLCLRNVPLPEPQDGDVLIRVRYAGVNPADSKARPADLGVNWRYQGNALIQPVIRSLRISRLIMSSPRNVLTCTNDRSQK